MQNTARSASGSHQAKKGCMGFDILSDSILIGVLDININLCNNVVIGSGQQRSTTIP